MTWISRVSKIGDDPLIFWLLNPPELGNFKDTCFILLGPWNISIQVYICKSGGHTVVHVFHIICIRMYIEHIHECVCLKHMWGPTSFSVLQLQLYRCSHFRTHPYKPVYSSCGIFQIKNMLLVSHLFNASQRSIGLVAAGFKKSKKGNIFEERNITTETSTRDKLHNLPDLFRP